MEKLKKTLLFYILGTVFTFLVLAIIHLNYSILNDFFWRSSWRRICKNAIIYGASIGAAFWILLTYKFPSSSLNVKFVINFLKPFLFNYLIGIVLALFLIAGIELYIIYFDTIYRCSTYYQFFGFSILLGIPLAIIFCNLKQLKR